LLLLSIASRHAYGLCQRALVLSGSNGGRETTWSRVTGMFPSSGLRPSRLCRDVFRVRLCRPLATLGSNHELGDDFALHLDVFNEEEQKILLEASLSKLDRAEDREYRKRRKIFKATRAEKLSEHLDVNSLFLSDQYYDFQRVTCCLNSNVVCMALTPYDQGHYDGVIKNYREMHVSAWPEDRPRLSELLNRLRRFHPEEPIQYHVLHLASDGEIYPHVDHLEAFGSWIVGVSLGSDRILRLEKENSDRKLVHDVILPSGSVYVQK
jgi:alkylated DNA repair protein alkB family protein 7